MIVGGKEGLDAARIFFRQLFNHGPGNGQAVVSGCTPPDFIEDDEAPVRGVVQDIGGFVHLDHEGRLAAAQVVHGPDPGKDPVHDAGLGMVGRDKTADMGHQDDERRLAQHRRFAGHVGAGNDQQFVFILIKMHVVGDKTARFHGAFDNRMAPLADGDFVTFRDHRLAVVIAAGPLGQAGQEVDAGQPGRGVEDPFALAGDAVTDIDKQRVFQLQPFFLGGGNFVFQLFEFRGNESFRIDQGLLADKVCGNRPGLGAPHLEVVAEDPVVADLELGDAGPFAFLLFQAENDLFAVAQEDDQLVQLFVKTFPDQVAVPERYRGVVPDSPVDQVVQVGQFVEFVADIVQKPRR